MDSSKVALRVGSSRWLDDARVAELIKVLGDYRGAINEVAFFTAETHAPLPLDVFEQRAGRLKEIIPRFRPLGVTAGINIIATIGHHEENLPGSLDMPWQRLVAPDGAPCMGSYCPSDENMQGYIRKIYQLAAGAEPDFIWTDDDVRLYGHIPVLCGCFCTKCMAIFSSETGQKWTRETLVAALDGSSIAEKVALRKKWLAHNRKVIKGVLAQAEQAAHGVNSRLALGFMTGERPYEGYDFPAWAETLRGKSNSAVMWRPGGGFYADTIPGELVGKAHEIGCQVSVLPSFVTDIQSEIENFPYHRLKKSVHITALEAATDLAAGSTGTAFNIITWLGEPLDEYMPFFEKIREVKPFYDLVAGTFERSLCEGLWFVWNRDVFAVEKLTVPWLKGAGDHHRVSDTLREFSEIGIPYSYSRQGSKVAAFWGDSPLMFEKKELEDILSGGVMMDGQAVGRFWEVGLGEYTGFKAAGERELDSIELFEAHPLNGRFAGWKRDCRQSFKWFWTGMAVLLKPVAGGAEVLASLVDYSDKGFGASMGVFENRLGGRVAVCGYYPWQFLHNLSKSSQIKSLVRWLSRDTIPAYASSFEKANVWCRKTSGGEYGVFVLNSSFDPIMDLELVVLTGKDELLVFDMGCREQRVKRSGDQNGGYARFKIPYLEPWTAVLAVPAGK